MECQSTVPPLRDSESKAELLTRWLRLLQGGPENSKNYLFFLATGMTWSTNTQMNLPNTHNNHCTTRPPHTTSYIYMNIKASCLPETWSTVSRNTLKIGTLLLCSEIIMAGSLSIQFQGIIIYSKLPNWENVHIKIIQKYRSMLMGYLITPLQTA